MQQGKPLVSELPLPVVDVAHAHAVFDDQFSHANAAALSFPETHWRQLEGPFLAGLPLSTPALNILLCCLFNALVGDGQQPSAHIPVMGSSLVGCG